MDIAVLQVIHNIPELLQYFVPGFLFMMIFTVLGNRKYSDTTITIWSIVISFIVVVMIDAVNSAMPENRNLSNWVRWLAIFATVIIFPLVANCAITSKLYKNKWRAISNRSIYNNLWEDVLDFELGTTIIAQMKDKNIAYIGAVAGIEGTLHSAGL